MQGHGTDFNLTQQPTKPGPWTGSNNENKNKPETNKILTGNLKLNRSEQKCLFKISIKA